MIKLERNAATNTALSVAESEARKSTCKRARCGSVVVDEDHNLIGIGFNSPPFDEINSRCERKQELKPGFKSDRTCCIHAEQRAIMNALRYNCERVKGGRLYFVRIDDLGFIKPSGKPYCTICSKMALDVGLKEFVLLHVDGLTAYDTKEYNDLSFEYNG